jgi:hypothetical protein
MFNDTYEFLTKLEGPTDEEVLAIADEPAYELDWSAE